MLWGDRARPHVRTMHGSSLQEALHIKTMRGRAAMTYYAACETIASCVADETVAVSRHTQRWLPWIRTCIPNGVDLAAFSPGEKSPHPTILFVGTYGQRKRGWLLVDAFGRDVLPRFPDAELWMVAEDSPSRPHVRPLGRVTASELQELYRRAWVFCLPSTYEGFGIPYIEAMASGTPVVATRNAGVAEVTAEGRYGLIVNDRELGPTIADLLDNRDLRARLSTAALEHVQQFNLGTIALAYESLYSRTH